MAGTVGHTTWGGWDGWVGVAISLRDQVVSVRMDGAVGWFVQSRIRFRLAGHVSKRHAEGCRIERRRREKDDSDRWE